ncbi:MAG TPA: lipopolysaccharide assembly protein LapA domain-containing protein [Stellaceae bacterium]|nr:lipopolysaccharide assembly protein LapA domain-containing protein [Stellaceae bacterium]
MRILYWLLVLVAAAVLSLFAASNRQAVSLGLWPLPYLLQLPLYLTIFLSLLAGFVVGVLVAWIAGRRWRREARRGRRRSDALTRELAATQARLADTADRPGSPPRRTQSF